jgi:coenzyme Q-binding protein COQ10
MGSAAALHFVQSAELPYTTTQMFDLVADVERYPEFLAEYHEVHIRSRVGDTLHVEQRIGFAAIEFSLRAVATLHRPHSITVSSHHLLMGDLEINWRFEPSEKTTRVTFNMELVPPSSIGAGLVGHLLAHSAERTLQAFTRRAHQIYGVNVIKA